MPQIRVNDIDIHYETIGSGDPLLMIIGLSFSLRDWSPDFLDRLAQHHQLILWDNRDAGETSQSSSSYTMQQMAADAVGLLAALGIAQAHVFGVSMGGMIAQQLALQYPGTLDRLVLGCTMAGGACSQVGDFQSALSGNGLELLLPPDYIQAHSVELTKFLAQAAPYRSQQGGLERQLYAVSTHDTCNRLDQITAPTLVITGSDDRVIPPQNSQYLADHIPGATLKLIDQARHGFCMSHAEQAANSMINFLR